MVPRLEARATGKGASASEKGTHSGRGKPGNCAKAWASAKPTVTSVESCVSARGWMTAGEQVALRGVLASCKGKSLKGGLGTAAA